MKEMFAVGLVAALSALPLAADEPRRAVADDASETLESLPSSFYDLFGYSMPEATSGMKKAAAPGLWENAVTALGPGSSVGFTKTASDTNSTCVTVPVYSAGPSGAALLNAEVVPTVAGSLLRVDFTSSLNLNGSAATFDGNKRDGIALVCRIWKKNGTGTGTPAACPGMGTFPFLISQMSGYNGSERYWAGHIGQGAYSGLVDLSSLSNPSGGWVLGTDSVVVNIQVMKAWNQGGTNAAPVPTSYACYSNLILQAN